MSNEADGVIEEINEEIKKAQGEPEEFEIEITDDPQEEVNDIVEEESKKEILILSMERKFKSAYRS